jgi:hypothetical protein
MPPDPSRPREHGLEGSVAVVRPACEVIVPGGEAPGEPWEVEAMNTTSEPYEKHAQPR